MLPASKMHNLPQISESLDELETLVREERDAPSQNVLVLDNGSFHRAKRLEVPGGRKSIFSCRPTAPNSTPSSGSGKH
jgi:hypothetical protein